MSAVAAALLSLSRPCSRGRKGVNAVDENEHPKGALLFMLIYLMTLSALWLNAYLRLWRG
jgi:hypothetical protein